MRAGHLRLKMSFWAVLAMKLRIGIKYKTWTCCQVTLEILQPHGTDELYNAE